MPACVTVGAIDETALALKLPESQPHFAFVDAAALTDSRLPPHRDQPQPLNRDGAEFSVALDCVR
jgi:hypothetical protein